MGIENIHAMSDSFQKLSKTWSKTTDQYYLSNIESAGWIKHLSIVLSSVNTTVKLIEDGNSVLTHCSDGWDRF
jgi:myotubularin-related protein 1/2